MGVQNPNSTSYVHPDEPNLLNLHKAMQYNDAGEPELRTHVHGITLEGNVIVDKVRVEVDTAHNTIDALNPVPVYYPTTPTVKLDSTTLTALETITVNQGTGGSSAWKVDIGTNGTVSLAAGTTVGVTGTFWPDTQAVSGTVNLGQTTLDALEHVSIDNFPAFPTSIDIGNWPTTQPVSGSVSITGPVEIKNDIDNPIPISKNLSVNSASNRIYVSMETDVVLADSNYELNVARGLVDGQYVEMKNGYAPSMASTSEGTVWGLNTAYPWSAWATPSRLWVASSSPLDVGQQIYIDGLDSNFARINSTVTLNGTTAVQTAETYYRINRMYQLTGASTAGNISARVTSSSGTQVGYMVEGLGRQKSGFFTVPVGYTAYILYGDASSYKNGSGNVSGQVDMYTRTNDGVTRPFLNQFAAVVANGQYRNEFNVPLRIPEKTDIDVRFKPSGNDTTVSVNWEMILIPN